ncbi:MAG: LPS-assembly protein LptD [Ignavibacteriales bacterium]|nr:LPS-assembly protein LptD [Ignavibacteriales bacterium]
MFTILMSSTITFATSQQQVTDTTNILDTTSVTTIDTTINKKTSDIDDVVYSSASDSIIFFVADKKMEINGRGEIKYKQTKLSAGKIIMDFNTNDLDAEGIVDPQDSTGIKIIQTPVLMEGSETYEGRKLKYNFKTRQGLISYAKSETQGSIYRGEKIKKVDKDTYFIKNAEFTTCDADTPHYNFAADEMKYINNDKIVARWIWMYIEGVPLPIPLPFGVFPNETGRRSGFIMPSWGVSYDKGQYFDNFGYFWAINDYIDYKINADYFLQGGYRVRNQFRYVKRYEFSGTVNADYDHTHINEPTDDDYVEYSNYRLSIIHNQKITPTMGIDANLNFMSNSFLENTSTNYNDRLTQNITSNATFRERWEESGWNLVVNYSRSQNLSTGNITETLPNISISKNTTYPFQSKRSGVSKEWYEFINFNYSGKFLNRRNKTNGDLLIRGGFQHDLNLGASPKIGYFNISPRISYQERWYNKYAMMDTVDWKMYDFTNTFIGQKDTFMLVDNNRINFVRTFSASISASTKLYGTWNINMLGIEGFRHTIIPTVSYNYRPDFSDGHWNYYNTYQDTTGKFIKYDKYQKEVFGGAPRGEQQAINFSIGNIFEIKTAKDPTDTSSQQEKMQLLNLNLSSGYNFAADSLNLSDLYLSFRTQIAGFLDISGSSNFSFYDYKIDRYGDETLVNQYLINNGKGLMRMTNFSFSLGTSLSGEKLKGKSTTKSQEQEIQDGIITPRPAEYIGIYKEEPADFSIPWNISLSYNYNYSKTYDIGKVNSSNINISAGINITEFWKINFTTNYDLLNNEIVAPSVVIYRDLHCWEMNLRWYPKGSLRGFRFEIKIKSSQFQDIKVTKSKGLFRGI